MPRSARPSPPGSAAEAAVDALTRRAAEIAGIGDRLGTIEPGKLGHLVVLTAPYGGGTAKIRYVLIDGMKFDLERHARPRGGPAAAASEKKARPDEAKPEPPQAHARAQEGKPAETQTPAPAGARQHPGHAGPSPGSQPRPRRGRDRQPRSPAATAPTPPASPDDQGPKFVDVASELDESRKPKIHTGGTVLIKDATILTVTKGTIAKGSILVQNGKIAAVGTEVPAPQGIAVIEAAGLVAMPGIIDTHSHMAIQGGVNEFSSSIVPEVRVKDVVTGDDPALYRALAGGTTTARILHGSANTIGGQDAVIKLRHGRPGRELIVGRRAAGGEVRPRRERQAVAGPVPEHPDGRRGDHRAGLRGSRGLPPAVDGLRRRRRPAGNGRPAPPPRPPARGAGRRPRRARSRSTATATARTRS